MQSCQFDHPVPLSGYCHCVTIILVSGITLPILILAIAAIVILLSAADSGCGTGRLLQLPLHELPLQVMSDLEQPCLPQLQLLLTVREYLLSIVSVVSTLHNCTQAP